MRDREIVAVAAPDQRPLTAQQITAQKNLIKQVQEAVMRKDVHYGTIPGTQKPTLYKAGAEAILTTFHIAVMPEVEDLSTHDCFRYRVTARGVMPDGHVVGCGVGECSTDEEKYRWRKSVCDEEFEQTPEDRRRIKFSSYKGSVSKTKQVRTAPADLANTVLKMAKKRAQIDLCLTATAASDVFEQDLDDLPAEYVAEHIAEQGSATKPAVAPPQSKAQATDKPITEGQVKMLKAKLGSAKISEDVFCAFYQIGTLELLPFAKMNEALKKIAAGEIVVAETSEKNDVPPPPDDLDRPFNEAEYA